MQKANGMPVAASRLPCLIPVVYSSLFYLQQKVQHSVSFWLVTSPQQAPTHTLEAEQLPWLLYWQRRASQLICCEIPLWLPALLKGPAMLFSQYDAQQVWLLTLAVSPATWMEESPQQPAL